MTQTYNHTHQVELRFDLQGGSFWVDVRDHNA